MNKYTLYVVTDPELARGRSHEEVAEQALAGGARIIQLRDKKASTKKLVETGFRLMAIASKYNAYLIINDRVDVALAIDAHGVHLGQDDLPAPLARKLIGPDKILGVSVDTPAEALAAVQAGADYLGAGAIFATATKEEAKAIGIQGLAAICQRVQIPVVAIGGIKKDNILQIIKAGATGVAVVSAVVSADNIQAATRELLAQIKTREA